MSWVSFYCVKRIHKREVEKFTDDTWMIALSQELEGNISIDIRFPWQDDSNFKNDEIYK
jgi:hypothetical protein